MRIKNAALLYYQSAQGILAEIAYSLALIGASFGVIYLILLFK